jgi:cell division protein ZapA
MKQLEVQIMGQSYLLGAPEGGEQLLLTAVERVDTAMCKIRDAGKVKARDRIAVLAALNLAFEMDRQQTAETALPTFGPTEPAGLPATPGTTAQDEAHLAALVSRLDHALNSDGQLL